MKELETIFVLLGEKIMKELETVLKVLGEKIKHLENVIFVKDLEIKELQAKLEKLEAKGNE